MQLQFNTDFKYLYGNITITFDFFLGDNITILKSRTESDTNQILACKTPDAFLKISFLTLGKCG